MKVYSYLSIDSFANCYLVLNEVTKQALIIDPGEIQVPIIENIEINKMKLIAVLITHNHEAHTKGLSTLKKIYDFEVYGADSEMTGKASNVLAGDGSITIAGMEISHYMIPGHSADSLVYKIENVLFTGDTLMGGYIGTTNTNYARKTLINNIKSKLLTQSYDTIIMPGHGPISTIEAEIEFNTDIVGKIARDKEKEKYASEVFNRDEKNEGWFTPPSYKRGDNDYEEDDEFNL